MKITEKRSESNSEQQQIEKNNPVSEPVVRKNVNLFEDMNVHIHDDPSYKQMLKAQEAEKNK
jgi:hypothetical protein